MPVGYESAICTLKALLSRYLKISPLASTKVSRTTTLTVLVISPDYKLKSSDKVLFNRLDSCVSIDNYHCGMPAAPLSCLSPCLEAQTHTKRRNMVRNGPKNPFKPPELRLTGLFDVI